MSEQQPRLEILETIEFSRQVSAAFTRSERGPNGEPTRADFSAFDLDPAKELIAAGFFDLPELIPGRRDYRVYTVRGRVARLFTIYAQLSSDGQTAELIELLVDNDPPEMA